MGLLRLVEAFLGLLIVCVRGGEPSFDEKLHVEHYGTGHIGVQFVFEQQWQPDASHQCNDGSLCHFHSFPSLLGKVLESSKVHELQLQLSKGWWDSDGWGPHASGSFAPGAELSILLPQSDSWQNWTLVRGALSGLYCSSLDALDLSRTYTPLLEESPSGLRWLKGVLPREAVCTENLSSSAKALPCRFVAGLGSYLSADRILSAAFYSLSLEASVKWSDTLNDTKPAVPISLAIRHTVTAVFRANDFINSKEKGTDRHIKWSLASLLLTENERKGKIFRSCPFSESSVVTVHGEGLEPLVQDALLPQERSWRLNETLPEQILVDGPFQYPLAPLPPTDQCHLRVSTSLAARGGTGGRSITRVECYSTKPCAVRYMHVIPTFMIPMFSTCKVVIGLEPVQLWDISDVDGRNAAASVYVERGRPSLLEFEVTIPAGEKLSVEFEFFKRFLSVDKFPPDPNRGMDVPSPQVTCTASGYTFRGESSLLDMPQPDFSMPFNVITLTCTLIALFLGSTLNILVRADRKKAAGAKGAIFKRALNRFRLLFGRNRGDTTDADKKDV